MNEILARLWQNLYARVTGPMNLRLIIQPAVATILAIRAGLRDAHQDRPAFFWAVLWSPTDRRELLRQGWKDVGKVFVLPLQQVPPQNGDLLFWRIVLPFLLHAFSPLS